jgi:hypothetical protein
MKAEKEERRSMRLALTVPARVALAAMAAEEGVSESAMASRALLLVAEMRAAAEAEVA